MKFPKVLKINYIHDGLLPIQTVESTHYIESSDDLSVLADFLGAFSEHDWDAYDVSASITWCEATTTTQSLYDSNLFITII